MARVVGPKVSLPASTGERSATVESAVDFIGSVLLVVFIPIGAMCVAAALGAFAFYGLGTWTGITAAWATLASQTAAPVSLSAEALLPAMMQNFTFAFVLSLVLAVPSIAKALKRTRSERLVKAAASPGAMSALTLGLTCFALHLVVSLSIAALLASFSIVLPGVGDFSPNLVIPGGGNWPPPNLDVLSGLGIATLVILLGAGIVFGMGVAGLAWTLALLGRGAVADAAGGAASTFGTTLARALTDGDERKVDFKGALYHGAAKGAVSGFAYAIVMLAGVAVLGALA